MDTLTFREQLAIKAQDLGYFWRRYLNDVPFRTADSYAYVCRVMRGVAAVQYAIARSHMGITDTDQNYA